MAREERKKEDLYIKPQHQRKTKRFFVTSSNKMNEKDGVSSTTISSSVFTDMSKSFADGIHLTNTATLQDQGPILYMLQEMQSDIDDVYNEVSASAFQASFFPFARMESSSFGIISSSLVPAIDSKYDLGTSGKEWNNLYVDGVAYIDNGQIGAGSFTGEILASQLGINGLVHLEKSPTTITQNGVLDARSKNLFILNNRVEITGILGGGITGQIVTVISLGSNVAHHAEKTVTSTSQFQFPLNRDLTFRGPVAHQFIYGGSYWVRLL